MKIHLNAVPFVIGLVGLLLIACTAAPHAAAPNPGDSEHEHFANFDPPVQFTSTAKSKRAVSVMGSGAIRLKTSTADGGADFNAKVFIRVY